MGRSNLLSQGPLVRDLAAFARCAPRYSRDKFLTLPHIVRSFYRPQCWCGGESTDYTTHGDSDACTVACAGDASQTCGGSYAINVFEHDTAAPPPGYLGCWKDSAGDRIMDIVESSSSMTNDVSTYSPVFANKGNLSCENHTFQYDLLRIAYDVLNIAFGFGI